MSDRVMLDVPFAENADVKALGARWDPSARSWYVPAGRDPAAFGRWVAHTPHAPPGPKVPVRVVLLPERCYRCAASHAPVLGAELPSPTDFFPDGFASIDWCAEAIAACVDPARLAAAGTGEIAWRTTRSRPDGYWANTCPGCQATIGSFYLVHEAIPELASEGVAIAELPGFEALLPAATFEIEDQDEDEQHELASGESAAEAPAPPPTPAAPCPRPRPLSKRDRAVNAWRRY